MNKYNRGRRGATLAELAIVIAVIAIVAVMVTSFIVMIDGSKDISQMKLDAMQDIVLAESVIENFIEDAVNNSAEGSAFLTYSDNRLMKRNGDILSFSNGILVVTENKKEDGVDEEGANNNNIVLELATVTKISFSAIAYKEDLPDNTVDNIFYCTITYNVGGDSDFDYTFCVNPYAGENIKEVTP